MNRLAKETSPYLLQHAHNPVDWYPWGDEAFEKARAENKPVFLSIGYSTCHWCHVMERESFENEAVAGLLNRHFVSVKVDREERPDVDRVYMLFVQATTGGGGWPMSVWLTPERKPFYGGTYFPPDNRYGRPGFAHVLRQIAGTWEARRAELIEAGEHVLAQLREHVAGGAAAPLAGDAAIEGAFLALRRSFDPRLGGFGGAPKFPRPAAFDFLLRYHHATGNAEALEMTCRTLDAMARGGMYDHAGGGFHRYSVDAQWFVPHFEKMLYDQAQLAVAYLEAYQVSGEARYARVARGVLDYVLRDLTHSEGGFYSAEDADSAPDPERPNEKSEGAFYLWSYLELEELLGAEQAVRFARAYGCAEEGNVPPHQDPHEEFTGRNILFAAAVDPGEEFADELKTLREHRATRPRPQRDGKVLAAWNGLMIGAFARAARVLDETRYLDAARLSAAFVLERLYDREANLLYRCWCAGEVAVEGFLDDYAALGLAAVELYAASYEPHWLELAARLAEAMLERFEDREAGGFFSTPAGARDILMRLKDDYDGAEPSGNSLAAGLLIRLAEYTGGERFSSAAARVFEALAGRLNQQPVTLPTLLAALLYAKGPQMQIVLAGPHEAGPLAEELRRRFLPQAIVIALDAPGARERFHAWRPATAAMRALDGAATAYVCQDFTCRQPVSSAPELAKLLE